MRFPRINMEKTAEKLTNLMKEKNISVKDIQEAMGFENPQAIYKWKRGESLPSIDNLIILCSLFGVRLDDILVVDE